MKAFEWLESGALFRPVCVHFRLLVAANAVAAVVCSTASLEEL